MQKSSIVQVKTHLLYLFLIHGIDRKNWTPKASTQPHVVTMTCN